MNDITLVTQPSVISTTVQHKLDLLEILDKIRQSNLTTNLLETLELEKPLKKQLSQVGSSNRKLDQLMDIVHQICDTDHLQPEHAYLYRHIKNYFKVREVDLPRPDITTPTSNHDGNPHQSSFKKQSNKNQDSMEKVNLLNTKNEVDKYYKKRQSV